MKLQGVLKRQLVQILVNSGNNDNFLNDTLAAKLNITPDNHKCMDVIVIYSLLANVTLLFSLKLSRI